MLDCESARPLLASYFDGELSPAATGEVEAHCHDCPACHAAVDRMRSLRDLLARSAPPPPPAGFAERVLAAARERAPMPRQARANTWAGAWGGRLRRTLGATPAVTAASLALGGALGAWLALDARREPAAVIAGPPQSFAQYSPVFETSFVRRELNGLLAEGYLTMESVRHSARRQP
jgi:anti-sigma factor RsiW